MVLTGAGVSTDSGIPDFRSEDGLWTRMDPMTFHIDRFQADPATFWAKRKEVIAAARYLDAEPNTAHHVLAQAARDGRIGMVVTQNIDGLHQRAGTPPDRLLEVHGNGARCVCIDCGRKVDTRHLVASLDDGATPRCSTLSGAGDAGGCDGLRKPDVVLFGEPVTAMPRAEAAVRDAATLIVAGTSLQVHPVAGLADTALGSGADLVVCNREPTPYDDNASRLFRGPVAETLARLLR